MNLAPSRTLGSLQSKLTANLVGCLAFLEFLLQNRNRRLALSKAGVITSGLEVLEDTFRIARSMGVFSDVGLTKATTAKISTTR